MINYTSPLAHRNPFWLGWDLTTTGDRPNLYEYLSDLLLLKALRTPPPTSTSLMTWEEK